MWIWNYGVSSREYGVKAAHADRARMVRNYGENLAEMDVPDEAVEVRLTEEREPDGIVVFMADVIVHLDPRDYPNLVPEP